MRFKIRFHVLLLLFNLSFFHAFKPQFLPQFVSDLIKGDDRTHEDITECALYRITYTLLKSLHGQIPYSAPTANEGLCSSNSRNLMKSAFKYLNIDFKGYDNVVDKIKSKNRNVDIFEQFSEESHFDSETLREGAERLVNLIDSAALSCKVGQFEFARISMGQLFHTAQDFYSHSNWVEFEPDYANDKLAKSEVIGKLLPQNQPACVSCYSDICTNNILQEVIANKLLTSGYFSLTSSKKPAGKCSHGGTFDRTSKTEPSGGINKDTLSAPHGYLHKKAARLAEASTYEILNQLWTRIGNKQFSSFLGIQGKDLVFVLRSAKQTRFVETDDLVEEAKSMLKQSNIFRYILSTYNEYGVNNLFVTEDSKKLSSELNKLNTNGGVEFSDYYYSAIRDALVTCDTYSILFAFANSPAKDDNLRAHVTSLALKKNIKIIQLLTSTSTNNRLSYIDLIEYNNLAKLTGGVTVFVTTEQIKNISNLLSQDLNDDFIQPILISTTFKTAQAELNFYVDATVEVLYFTFSMAYLNSTVDYKIFNPTGSLVQQNVEQIFTSSYTTSFKISKPLVGNWKIVSNRQYQNVKVVGQSSISIRSSFNEVLNDTLEANFTELVGSPVQGSRLYIKNVVENNPETIKEFFVSIVSEDYTPLEVLKPNLNTSNEFYSSFIVPKQPFRLKITAKISATNIIERCSPTLFIPSTLSLQILNQENTIHREINQTYVLEYKISNTGDQKIRAKLSIDDNLNLIDFTEIIELAPKETIYRESVIDIKNRTDLKNVVNVITVSVYDSSLSPFENMDYDTLYLAILSNKATILKFKIIFFIILYFINNFILQ